MGKIVVTKQAWKQNYLGEIEKMDREQRVLLCMRVVIFGVSAVGFLYQLSLLMAIYWSDTTDVDNRVEHLRRSELPAITICLPTFLDMEKFAENYLKNSTNSTEKNIYLDYQKFKSEFKGEWTNASVNEQERLYNLMAEGVFIHAHIPLEKVFNDLSVDVLKFDNVSTDALNDHDNLIDLPRPQTFVSIVPFLDPRLCFTMFSQYDNNYGDMKYNLLNLELLFTHDNNSFPLKLYEIGDFHIALHSPNDMPRYIRQESFKYLTMGKINMITYTSTHSYRLPAPYDTHCKEYELDRNPENQMRSDCKQECIDKKMHSEVNCLFTKDNYYLTRKDNLREFSSYFYCDHHFLDNSTYKKFLLKKQLILEIQCDRKCMNNCHDISYEFTSETVKVHSWVNQSNQFAIKLEHNRIPDQIIRYKPVMSFIEMMSNFGGLLGMWLGLSISFILETIVKSFLKNKII